jgi:hypothetical protein
MEKLFQKDAIDIGQYISPATKYRYRAVRRLEVSPDNVPKQASRGESRTRRACERFF